ncbi:hypothetical protein PINS_up012907 [Pythium insidiosum]|nr:hypothetical protein PINS_up012907 [Pythium insidiosum]
MPPALYTLAAGDAQLHAHLLLPFLSWLDLSYLSSVSRDFAQQSVREEFFRRSLVVIPDATMHQHHVRAVLHRLSTFTRRIALWNVSYLPALARLPALRTLRLTKPLGSRDPADRLTAEHAAMIWRLESVVHLELDASIEASSDTVRLLLSDLRRLHHLRLSLYFRISDLQTLTHLKRLESLDITCAMLEDIEGLRALPQLKVVRLSSWMVQDFTPLEALVNCERLDLSRCNISDLTPVGRLERLCVLCLADTPVRRPHSARSAHATRAFESRSLQRARRIRAGVRARAASTLGPFRVQAHERRRDPLSRAPADAAAPQHDMGPRGDALARALQPVVTDSTRRAHRGPTWAGCGPATVDVLAEPHTAVTWSSPGARHRHPRVRAA